MRYVWTIIWSFVLMQMIYYVLANMNGAEYSFATALIMSLIIAAFVAILGESISDSETNQQ